MTAPAFTSEDRRQLEKRGISLEEARRQLALLAEPRHYVELVRPATVGDGIVRIEPEGPLALAALHAEAAAAGRFVKFVPASGAASRMFAALVYFLDGDGSALDWDDIVRAAHGGDGRAAELEAFVTRLDHFAFHEALEAELRRRGHEAGRPAPAEFRSILHALLDADGLNYVRRPKGLIEFHREDGHGRTAFEEHLVEAAHYAKDGQGLCRLHLTVHEDQREAFETLATGVLARYEDRFGARFEIDYSTQNPSTDTLALDDDGRPSRDGQGRLRFRPAGHGALIENLAGLGADLVFVKNIDNVQPDRLKRATYEWKPALAGCLLLLQSMASHQLERLRTAGADAAVLDEALAFVRESLNVELDLPREGEARRAALIDRIDRPLRVCGVVPNTGEPGGGPFWARGADGSIGLQIVETAQIDHARSGQQTIVAAATHFNPVDLVCSVRDASGRPYDLTRFIDREAVIVTRKAEGGREFRALERPGLWNGAMAGWNTAFVEVPIETFSPVKTVADLLRDEHS